MSAWCERGVRLALRLTCDPGISTNKRTVAFLQNMSDKARVSALRCGVVAGIKTVYLFKLARVGDAAGLCLSLLLSLFVLLAAVMAVMQSVYDIVTIVVHELEKRQHQLCACALNHTPPPPPLNHTPPPPPQNHTPPPPPLNHTPPRIALPIFAHLLGLHTLTFEVQDRGGAC